MQTTKASSTRLKSIVGAAVVVALATVGAYAGAQAGDDPNQPVSAPEPRAGSSSPTENAFVPITPCRIVDTRQPGAGGRLTSTQVRQYGMSGNTSGQGGAANCGIPSTATALEISASAVFPLATGYLRIYPAGVAEPNATFLNYTGTGSTTNAGTVAVRAGGSPNFQVKAYQGATFVVIDVLGYYVSDLMATIDINGNVFAGISNGVVSSTKLGTGRYRVTFNRNISGCAAIATVHSGSGAPRELTVSPSGTTAVEVFVYTSAGVASDRAFNLSIEC